MERVSFLVEATGERFSCMLNPETLVLSRRSGIRRQKSSGGLVTGAELSDEPVLLDGGGSTEMVLDLLFDVLLDESRESIEDVRQMTGPLFALTENARRDASTWGPARVLFFWGKSWAVPGVITAIAERLDQFSRAGVPQRAWVRLKLLRVAEDESDRAGGAMPPPVFDTDELLEAPPELPMGPTVVHEVRSGSESVSRGQTDRLDQLAYNYYGDPNCWRLLAWLNGIDDPLQLRAGEQLRIAADWDLEAPQ